MSEALKIKLRLSMCVLHLSENHSSLEEKKKVLFNLNVSSQISKILTGKKIVLVWFLRGGPSV